MLGAHRSELFADTSADIAVIQHKTAELYSRNLAKAASMSALLAALSLIMLVRHGSARGDGGDVADFAFWLLGTASVSFSLHASSAAHLTHTLAPEAALHADAAGMAAVVRELSAVHARVPRFMGAAVVLFCGAALALLLKHSTLTCGVALALVCGAALACGFWIVRNDLRRYARHTAAPGRHAATASGPAARGEAVAVQRDPAAGVVDLDDNSNSPSRPQIQMQMQMRRPSVPELLAQLAAKGPQDCVRHEGLMKKRGRLVKTWRLRWFVLERGVLRYFERRDGVLKGTLQLFGEGVECRRLDSSDVHAKGAGRGEVALVVRAGRRELFLRVFGEAEAQLWVARINSHAGWATQSWIDSSL